MFFKAKVLFTHGFSTGWMYLVKLTSQVMFSFGENLKGNSSPKSFFVYRPTFSKEESGRNRRARSEQERANRAPRDCSHSRSAPCIPSRDTPPSAYVTCTTHLADPVSCEGFLFLYSKAFVGARERLDFGCLFDFPRISRSSAIGER